MRVGRFDINPIDVVLAVLVPVTVLGLYAEFREKTAPQDVIRAAREGDIATVWKYVDTDFDFLARDDRGRTVLHAAAEFGNPDTVQYILEQGGGVALNVYDNQGYTPVHLSLGIRTPYGRVQRPTIKTFLQHGADPNAKTRFGETMLVSAIESHQEESAIALIEAGAVIDVGLVDGAPLLSTVSRYSMDELLEELLKRGAAFGPTGSGHTPLAEAIKRGEPNIVQMLIEHGANPNGRIKAEVPPPNKLKNWSSLRKWYGRGGRGDFVWRPLLVSRSRPQGRIVEMLPLDFALWHDTECAIVLIENGARAELFPKLMVAVRKH